jgi:hypothetical protein
MTAAEVVFKLTRRGENRRVGRRPASAKHVLRPRQHRQHVIDLPLHTDVHSRVLSLDVLVSLTPPDTGSVHHFGRSRQWDRAARNIRRRHRRDMHDISGLRCVDDLRRRDRQLDVPGPSAVE